MAHALKKTGPTDRPAADDPTVAFYDADPQGYARDTLASDISHLYPRFLQAVPSGGLILDAGCGAGRDVAEFVSRGYCVEAFDASSGLATLASRHTGVDVEVARFEDVPPRPGRYDGIWCFASLLHVARPDLPPVLSKLAASLRPGAPLFASFKRGGTDTVDVRGRRFTNFTIGSLRSMFEAVTKLSDVEVWEEDGPSALDGATRWLYVEARRAAAD